MKRGTSNTDALEGAAPVGFVAGRRCLESSPRVRRGSCRLPGDISRAETERVRASAADSCTPATAIATLATTPCLDP